MSRTQNAGVGQDKVNSGLLGLRVGHRIQE